MYKISLLQSAGFFDIIYRMFYQMRKEIPHIDGKEEKNSRYTGADRADARG